MKKIDPNLLEEYSGLFELLELHLEERISPDEFARLESMIRHDSTARQLYLQYIDLHGMLHYDTAAPHLETTKEPQPIEPVATIEPHTYQPGRQPSGTISVAVSCLVLAVLVGYFIFAGGQEDDPNDLADGTPERTNLPDSSPEVAGTPSNPDRHGPIQISPKQPERTPIVHAKNDFDGRDIEVVYNAWEGTTTPASPNAIRPTEVAVGNSNSEIIAFINREIQKGWNDFEVAPSPQSDDSEWVRRTYLDIVGHIPTAEDAQRFLASKDPNKREALIEELLDDEDYVRNWTTVWTNLLIGRSNPREVDRPALKKFLRESFALNRGWDDVVAEFVSAQGNHKESGATNFLLAHVNDQALPATATVSRLFLGQQLQCLQCHDHPFNDWQQSKFWGFHGFFSQMEVASNKEDTSLLDNGGVPEAIFYERRNGLLRATSLEFDGHKFQPESDGTRLRSELAELMTSGASTDVARAFVNRMWQHFFGAAFTPVVDDMGPHAVPSHPELLEGLAQSFVRSGYDVKQLIRWMTSSDAYQLSSQFGESNQIDNPAAGQLPLFSRAYVKSMTVEQAFDSLMVATRAGDALGSDWEAVDRERQQIQRQFVMQWETEDNDEANLFDGSVPQALMMMNSPLIQKALDSSKGTYIGRVVRSSQSETQKIEAVALAALSRRPTERELAAVRQLTRAGERHPNFEASFSTNLEDLFWAYLNSNEFILLH